MGDNQSAFEKFEVVKFGPYRFVGKSVYLGNKRGTEVFFDFMWKQSDWVFKELDKMKEYASDETHNAALIPWDKHYDDKSELFGYYIGRFMKAGAPMTKEADLDYFDISEGYVAKAWRKEKAGKRYGIYAYNDNGIHDAMKRAGFNQQGWNWSAEIILKTDSKDENLVGAYIPCELINKSKQ